jgi:hypothetical protein
MRYLTSLGAVALTAALCTSGMSCAAQDVPSGSYRQSCKDIGTNGSTLYATCRNANGDWQSSQLQEVQRCAGDVGNNNGFLSCEMRPEEYQPARQGWQNGVPAGTYVQTCQDISTNGNTLEARCDTGSGSWNRTSLQNIDECTGGIDNLYGRLTCNKRINNEQVYRPGDQQGDRYDNGQGYRQDGQQDGPPSGVYMETCQNIKIVGSTLQASCQRRNGTWRRASLSYFDQCSGEIENRNGRLFCTR